MSIIQVMRVKKNKQYDCDDSFPYMLYYKNNHCPLSHQQLPIKTLIFTKLCKIKMFYMDNQHIKLKKVAASIQSQTHETDTQHLDSGQDDKRGVYPPEHLVADQMSPVKLENFNILDLLLRVECILIRPWEVHSRRFMILSGLCAAPLISYPAQ